MTDLDYDLAAFETDVLELTQRHVRTPEGMKKYNLPIGALITADAIAYAEKQGYTHLVPEDKGHGGKANGAAATAAAFKAPKENLPGTISAKKGGKVKPPKPAKAAPAPKVSLKAKPELTGNQHFSVGNSKYVAPNGSKLIRPVDNPNMAYVVTPEGKVHAFVEGGEINIPSPLDKVLESKFNDFDGDDQYKIDVFEKTGATHDMAELQPGQVLTDQAGNPQFKKLANDSWEHIDLGVKLKDADIQPLYDSGDLIPDKNSPDSQANAKTFDNTPATNFADMSKEEAQKAFEDMPAGQQVTLKVASGDGEHNTVLTKSEDGTFHSDLVRPGNKGVTAEGMAFLKNQMHLGAEPAQPHHPLDMHSEPNPLDSNPSKLIGDKPDHQWVMDATPGAQIQFESQTGKLTVWTKSDNPDGSWTNEKGGTLTQNALLDYMSSTDQGASNLTIKKNGKLSKELAASRKGQDLNKPVVGNGVEPIKIDTSSDGLGLKAKSEKAKRDKIYADVAAGVEPTPPSTPQPVEGKAVDYSNHSYEQLNDAFTKGEFSMKTLNQYTNAHEKLGPGSTVKEASQALNSAKPGTQVHLDKSPVTFTKQPDGMWQSGANGNQYKHTNLAALYAGALVSGSKPEAKFGDKNYFYNAPVGTVVYVNSSAYMGSMTFGDDGYWHGEDPWGPVSYAPDQMSRLQSDRKATIEQDAIPKKTFDDISLAKNSAEAKQLMDEAHVGAQIHPADSDATLTKQPDGSWQSSITRATLSSQDITDLYSEPGDLRAGAAGTKTVKPKTAKPDKKRIDISNIDQASSLAQMSHTLENAPEGEQVHVLGSNPPHVFTKQKDGLWESSNTGWQAEPLELAQWNWSEEKQKSELLHGDGAAPLPPEPDSGKIPDGVPEGSVQIHDLSSVPTGGTVYEAHPDNGVYTHKKVGPDDYTSTTGSGFKIPGNTANDLKQVMDDAAIGTSSSKFYLEPQPANGYPVVGDKIDSKAFDSFEPGQMIDYSYGSDTIHYEYQGDGKFFSPQVGTVDASGLKAAANESSVTLGKKNDMAETKKWEKGVHVSGHEDLSAQEVGTKIAYAKNNGKTSYYTKLQGNSYLSPGGQILSSHDLHTPATQGKLTIHETPAAPAATPTVNDEPAFFFTSGDKITDFGQLSTFQPGQKLEMKYDNGDHMNYVVLQDNGTWKVPDDAPQWPGLEFTNGDMADAMKKGGVFYVSTDGISPLTKGEVKSPENQLWDGAPALTHDQLSDALKGLEEHSSFHVAYGLKGLPDDNPLKDPVHQNALKEAAMEANPDLKAKPAVVKYLQDHLGISNEPLADWEKALLDDGGPKITVGSKDPKKVGVQGMDGGEYSQKDIQGAIDILEAYNGKLFKSELNKKGNPLGELDPTSIVGFDKDKLVTKQKFIDTLKDKLTTKQEVQHPNAIKSMDEFKSFDKGTEVKWHSPSGHEYTYTKISDEQWQQHGDGDMIDNSGFQAAIDKGYLTVSKKPDVVPDYAKTPVSVQSKEKQALNIDDPNFSKNDLYNAPDGTQLVWGDSTDGNVIEKIGTTQWAIYGSDGHLINVWNNDKLFDTLSLPNHGGWSSKEPDNPEFNQNAVSAIIPGKYASESGTAYMIVNADGSGTYVSSKGESLVISASDVKKNYDVGMKKYLGLPTSDDAPKAEPTPAVKKKSPVVTKPKTVESIPDGNFFGGNPSDSKSSYYEISGDTVKVFKPMTGLTTSTGVKLHNTPNQQWLEESGTGAAFTSGYHYDYPSGQNVNETFWTKGADGLWHGKDHNGNDLGTKATADINPAWYDTVTNHGLSDPVTIPKSKVNTIFAKGEMTDQYGLPIVPEGYTGSLHFFGQKTNVPSLLKVQKYLSETTDAHTVPSLTKKLNELGVGVDSKNFGAWRASIGSTEPGYEATKNDLLKALGDVLSGVDASVPESDASSLFTYNDLGQAQMPLELAAKPNPGWGAKAMGDWIKDASAHFGDGKIIGQHWGKMDTYTRNQWINAFKKGDFKTMYNLEVQAASKEGKAHNSGYLHPGFPDNTETHKIAWAAAVDGEVSALDTVPGDWSSYKSDASAAEIDNYLIKAQMQNPTYLSATEKRQWYYWHRDSMKENVDGLSATAAMRKQNGEAQLTSPPTWTDNLQPAKSYDTLFENDPLPTTGWTTQKALDYVNDVKDSNPELKALYEAKVDQGYGQQTAAHYAVAEYFQGVKDAETAKLNKVFYKKSPVQKVQKGTHPIFEYDDWNGHGPVGNHYFFKPSPQGDAYRSDAEHLGHEFGWTFGFNTSGSELTTLDGKYGQLQKDLGSVGSLANHDMSTLTASQIADIGKEHILDWFLDNDDTHSENMQMLPNGQLVGIDKGRAFKHFGAWNGLDPQGMNSNAQTVYSKLFAAIKSGKLSKEDVDKAYLLIQKRAQQMSKVDDQKIKDMLATGMAKRKIWDIKYSIDGKKVSNDLAGLQAAVIDRKNKLPEQIKDMWAKVYKDAGFGDLPEPPPAKLGEEHYSGLDEAHFHEAAFKVNGGGVSALLAGAHTTTGSATVWGTVNKDGSKDMITQMELNHVHDEKVLSKLEGMAPDAVTGVPSKSKFSDTEYGANYTEAYYRAMATIVKHNADGTPKAFNADRIAEYEAAKGKLQKDLDFWSANPTPNADGNVKFPSGAEVPLEQIGQYKNMLDFYKSKEQYMDASIQTEAEFPIGQKEKFGAYTLAQKPKHYINSTSGSSLVELSNGDYLHSHSGGTAVLNKDAAAAESAGAGWQDVTAVEDPSVPKFGGAQVTLNSKPFETKGPWNVDTGEIGTSTVSVGKWVQGTEYQVTLPTGEVIYFRNRAKTGTLKSQYGRMTIHVPGSKNGQDYAAGVQRANDWIETYLGLDMSGAEENSAELVYWKQMLPILTRRKPAAGSKYAKALKDVQTKASELGITTDDFQYVLGDHMTVDEQNAFYRKLWGDHFGKDKVDKLIASQGYLPKYEKTDVHSKDINHGKPVWHRLDVTLADILASDKNSFVASHSTGGADSTKDVATSGVHLSTEERIRFFGGKDGGSSTDDQIGGSGGQDQFTRVWNDASHTEYDFVFHPSVMLHTNTRFFSNDAFGKEVHEPEKANPDPVNIFSKQQSNSGSLGGGKQLDIRWASSLMGTLEMVLFDNAADRDYAIQKMKKAGLAMIRGLPVEDRLIMRQDRVNAIAKLRAQWQIEATP